MVEVLSPELPVEAVELVVVASNVVATDAPRRADQRRTAPPEGSDPGIRTREVETSSKRPGGASMPKGLSAAAPPQDPSKQRTTLTHA